MNRGTMRKTVCLSGRGFSLIQIESFNVSITSLTDSAESPPLIAPPRAHWFILIQNQRHHELIAYVIDTNLI